MSLESLEVGRDGVRECEREVMVGSSRELMERNESPNVMYERIVSEKEENSFKVKLGCLASSCYVKNT